MSDLPARLDLNVADAMLLAGDLFRAWRFADAEALFRQILMAEPSNLHATNALAVCLIEQNKGAEALPFLDRTGTLLRDELVTVTCNRGRALADLGRAEEALAAFDLVLGPYPGHLLSRYNRGLVLLQMGRCKQAIADFDAVLAAGENDKARFGRGFANLVLGNYADGFRDYECRLKDKIDEPDVPLWTGAEPLEGKTILVHGEQGLGDNIMFARYLPMLVERGAKVLVWVPSSVKPLLAHLPGVTVLGDDREAWPAFDYWVRFMSLALCFGTTAETVPPPVPLRFDPAARNGKRDVIRNLDERGRSLRVGLCWSGSPQSRYDAHRSIPLAELAPLFDLPGIQFFSLQLAVRERDRPAFERAFIADLTPFIETFSDTANLMAELDLVITVDTSVAHLAGTVGVPTLVMLTAFRTYWLWIEKLQTSPWYPSARVLRQERDGEWGLVVARVCGELRTLTAKAA